MRDLAVAIETSNWTTEEAIVLAKKVEAICPPFGYHVALTGGLLYKEGPRKDCDLVLYQTGSWNKGYKFQELLDKLGTIGIAVKEKDDIQYCYKAKYEGKSLDIIFPEFSEYEY